MEVPSSSGCGTVNGIDHFGLEVYLLGGTCPELDVTTSKNLARMEKMETREPGRKERAGRLSLAAPHPIPTFWNLNAWLSGSFIPSPIKALWRNFFCCVKEAREILQKESDLSRAGSG